MKINREVILNMTSEEVMDALNKGTRNRGTRARGFFTQSFIRPLEANASVRGSKEMKY